MNTHREESVNRYLGKRVYIADLRICLCWFRSSDNKLLARLGNTIDLLNSTVRWPRN
jgi:hypothetical protein